ncbi:MAG: hypothetical protein ACRCYX_02430 [Dermatophilaceae bacterium]
MDFPKMKSMRSKVGSNRSSVNRVALLAVVAFGAVSAVGATAQAQEGSRLCGHYYTKNGIQHASLIEVRKGAKGICKVAQDNSDNVSVSEGWKNVQAIFLAECGTVAAKMKYKGDPCSVMNRADDRQEAGNYSRVRMWTVKGVGKIQPVDQYKPVSNGGPGGVG